MKASREQLRAHRQIFWGAWQRELNSEILDALQVRIVRVIHEHPEYHPLFDDEESFLDRDFSTNDGMNPYLHLSLHLALEEQVATHQPAEAANVLVHLMQRKGLNRHDGLHVLLEILAETVFHAQQKGGEPDVLVYQQRLQALLRA
ncbi:MAG: DUF1841 family protein [Mariprofundaceae bacterium]|nr:DUF1841 family protein [Mariprofundaceae bacterium]